MALRVDCPGVESPRVYPKFPVRMGNLSTSSTASRPARRSSAGDSDPVPGSPDRLQASSTPADNWARVEVAPRRGPSQASPRPAHGVLPRRSRQRIVAATWRECSPPLLLDAASAPQTHLGAHGLANLAKGCPLVAPTSSNRRSVIPSNTHVSARSGPPALARRRTRSGEGGFTTTTRRGV